VSKSIVIAAAASAILEPAPISPDWILDGTPEAENKIVAKSLDGTSYTVVWQCTAGLFNWHYSEDETVVVISGEVFVTTETGEECLLREGDIAFFPAGSSAVPAASGCLPARECRVHPAESLGLQAGEWVKVKTLKSIMETSDELGQNRGLRFSPDMRLACGKRLQVKGRIDELVVDGRERCDSCATRYASRDQPVVVFIWGLGWAVFTLRIRLLAGDLASPVRRTS
jgi:uncharacterized cupin superfamily protein